MGIFKKGKYFAGGSKWVLLKGLLHDLRVVEMFVSFVSGNRQQPNILLWVGVFKYFFPHFSF